MNNFFKKADVFIKELQGSDESRKKKWIVGSAVAIMIIVVGLWMIYANFTFPSIKKEGVASAVQVKDSFFEVFSRGLGVVSKEFVKTKNQFLGSIGNGLENIKKQTEETNNLEVSGVEAIGFFKDWELIPPGKFPLVK